MPDLLQSSFNAGEITPRAGGRVDLAKYTSALSTCRNALPQPHGGVTRRPGTEYIATTKTSSRLCRLIPFEYSKEQAYILEFGHNYIRFYMDGGQVQSFDSYTKLCIHPEGNNASSSFDDDADDKAVTTNGSVKIDSSKSPFSTGVSARFPGTTSDYLSLADSDDWNMADGTLTFDRRARFNSLPSTGEAMILHAQYKDTDNFAIFFLTNSSGIYRFTLALNTAGTLAYPINGVTWTTPVVDTWYHIALIRGWGGDGDVWTVCIDGVSLGSTTLATTYPDVAGTYQIGYGTLDNVSPLAQSDDYVKATTKFSTNHWPYFTTDPSKNLNGAWTNEQWISANGVTTNQRFHIDIGVAAIVGRIYYENSHNSGAETDMGVQNFTLWGSNEASAFAELTYATDTNWVQLTTSQSTFDQHASADAADPKYINVYSPVAYRYYAFKFADNYGDATVMGVRRIELQYGEGVAFDGWLAEERVSKGIARWTENFVPPTTRYPLSSGASVYEVTTTYNEDELFSIGYCQSADTLYLVHPDHPPAKLTRTDHDDWDLEEIDFDWPPFLDENTTTATIDPSATTNDVTCVASQSLFTEDWVGSSIKMYGSYINIASYQSVTECSGNVISTLSSHDATDEWAKSAWDEIDGYPCCVTFFEERLCFAGTDKQPQTLWLSVSGDYENFNAQEGSSIADTDACTYTIQSDHVNAIRWIMPLKKLVIGTTGGEWLASGSDGDPVTPTNIQIWQDTGYGCHSVRPAKTGNIILFVQRAGEDTGKTVREYGYDFSADSYKGNDLSILAEHLIRTNYITDMAYQRHPSQILWCIRNDGDLIALTYLREHDVVGWSRHDTDGEFESVAVIPGTEEDEVWFVVNRTVNSSTVRYIERFKATWNGEDLEDAFYVDSGLTYDGVAVNTATGLSHLEGKSLNILIDGVMNTATTVSGGSIILDSSASVVQAGLPFTTDIETLRCAPVEVQGKTKRIHNVVLRLYETAGYVYIGPDDDYLDTHNVGTNLFDGDLSEPFRAGYETDGKMFIRKTDALPITILAAIPELESYP